MIQALVLLACLQGDSAAPAEDRFALFADARCGVWASGGWEFEGVQIDGIRSIDANMLYTAGLDVGVELWGAAVLFAGAEYAWAGDVTLEAFSIGAGWTTDVPEFVRTVPPFRFTALVAAMHGEFDVDEDRFAAFEDGWGVRAGVKAMFHLWGAIEVGLYAELRHIRFKYEEPVLDGDRYAGGGGFAGGASLEVRF